MAIVKTAISVDEKLFKEAHRMARKLGIPRSRLFSMALEEYMRQEENKVLLQRLNQAYAGGSDQAERKAMGAMRRKQRAMVEGGW
jgi:metal-responsive CopG/Arc/MetJ family transcriptional regulator